MNPGIFANACVTAGESGKIQSLNEAIGPVILQSAFMTFHDGDSSLSLFITDISASTSGPFVLFDTPFGGVSAFNLDGYIQDSTKPNATENFTGTFSMTFAGETVNRCWGRFL